jgi:hypothetical protein
MTNETDAEIRARQAREHEEKYETLAAALGWDDLVKLVPFPLDQVRLALNMGDEYLNTLALASWDRAAINGATPHEQKTCSVCGHVLDKWKWSDWPYDALRAADRVPPWNRRRGLSLAERVCVLKHVARVEAMKTKGGGV